MITKEKVELINRCLTLSREQPNTTIYGTINPNGRTSIFTDPYSLEIVIEKYGEKVYCKAKNGSLTL